MTVNNTSHSITRENLVVKPLFFNLNIPEELSSFQKLVKNNSQVRVCNQIDSQLIELMKIKHPKRKLTDSEALYLAEAHVGHKNFVNYGVWVYYPWNFNLVHLLPEHEFIQTRTSRNHYKITPEEQQKLSSKSVGVIGLSVGQSISLTMAMERVFGEIRIADFDNLELTNLNRIRAGVHQIGLPKVALVAREIAEIDPFLNVSCFWEGITEENVDQFLLGGGKLDLVADECDTIHMKFFTRERCKKLQIPVLMDTSDRGMIDIERFDLEPERPIFHGLVEHLDISKSKHLKTNEEKVAYALPIIGINQASNRIKASMMEIEQTITTWPQLSSDVALGGAISTNVIRRVFLNQHAESGRFYVDTNELIPDTEATQAFKYNPNTEVPVTPLENKDLKILAQGIYLNPSRIRSKAEHEDDILNKALHAPSGANCQPWKWLISENAYFLFHDKHFSYSFNDYKDSASHLAMGCAIENFTIAAQEKGYQVHSTLLPAGENVAIKAVIQLFDSNQVQVDLEPVDSLDLAQHLLQRFTNRKKSNGVPVSSSELEFMRSAAERTPGAALHFLTAKDDLEEIAEIIALGDQVRLLHPQSHFELFNRELREGEENLKYRDGIDMELMDLSPSDRVGIKIAKNPKVIEYLNRWNSGSGLGKMSKTQVLDSSAVGLITMPDNSALSFIKGGQATEKAWLAASKLNVAFHPMTVIPYFLTRLNHGKGEGFDSGQLEIMNGVWARFQKLFPVTESTGLTFLFRVCKADSPTKSSLRRNKNQMVHVA